MRTSKRLGTWVMMMMGMLGKGGTAMAGEADVFLKDYLAKLRDVYVTSSRAGWKAANTGRDEDFAAKAAAELAYKTLHSDPKRFQQVRALLARPDALDSMTRRSLSVALLEFTENQLPRDTLKKLVEMSGRIEQTFNTYRGSFEGKTLSNNELLDLLERERDSNRRRDIWMALKQVGGVVASKLTELAKERNRAARQLGYKNFWDMRVRLQEHDPDRIMALFGELERLTEKPFADMKQQLDAELARKFKVKPSEIRAWHYDDPFFQSTPPSGAVDVDEFYRHLKREDVLAIAKRFFADLGLPIDEVAARSDLYERPGKDQHAFCTDMDHEGDVRTLQNVRPRAESMDTMLHEMGHGVYSRTVDRTLPYNLRDAAHIFTTEAVAMMFGALNADSEWLIHYVGADPETVAKARLPIAEQRRREQLIFARWTLVMLHFERALYENPDQDLNTLWWDMVERFQKVPRPVGRNAPDWAAKPHFTIAPVYYHNYMMGELFASQLRARLGKLTGSRSSVSRKDWGQYLRDKVFRPGARWAWPEFVKEATGEELTAAYFAEEVK